MLTSDDIANEVRQLTELNQYLSIQFQEYHDQATAFINNLEERIRRLETDLDNEQYARHTASVVIEDKLEVIRRREGRIRTQNAEMEILSQKIARLEALNEDLEAEKDYLQGEKDVLETERDDALEQLDMIGGGSRYEGGE